MIGPFLPNMKLHYIISSNDANGHENAIESYARVVNYLPTRQTTDAVSTKPDEDFTNFKQGSFTSSDLSHKWLDLVSGCGGVYNGQMLRGFFVVNMDLSTCSAMCCWCGDNRETTIKNLDHLGDVQDCSSSLHTAFGPNRCNSRSERDRKLGLHNG